MPKRRSRHDELDSLHPNLPLLVVRAPGPPVTLADLFFKQTATAERLKVDRARYLALRRADFCGPEWDAFHDELWSYALPVLTSGMRTGKIFTWCWRADMIVKPTSDQRRALHTSSEDRDELAIETIAITMKHFRNKTLRKGGWRPRKGASLKTFFIGACILQFGQVFRRWQRERADRLGAFGYGTQPEVIASEMIDHLGVHVDDYVASSHTLSIILSKASTEVRMACYLLMQERTYAEIADELGVSERTIEGQFYRLRKRVRTLLRQGAIDVPGFLQVAA